MREMGQKGKEVGRVRTLAGDAVFDRSCLRQPMSFNGSPALCETTTFCKALKDATDCSHQPAALTSRSIKKQERQGKHRIFQPSIERYYFQAKNTHGWHTAISSCQPDGAS